MIIRKTLLGASNGDQLTLLDLLSDSNGNNEGLGAECRGANANIIGGTTVGKDKDKVLDVGSVTFRRNQTLLDSVL